MSTLDWLLLAALLLGLPTSALWRSFRPPARPRTLAVRYGRSMLSGAALAALLLWIWRTERRPWASLGLEWPISTLGLVAIVAAGILLGLLVTSVMLSKTEGKVGEEQAAMLPSDGRELALYLLMALTLGLSWELLYRGYALWALEPVLGTAGAVGLGAIAYGLAHGGYRPREWIGPTVMALLFAAAYAATRSLWWLILIHIALPLIGLLAGRRAGMGKAGGPDQPAFSNVNTP